MNRFQQREQTAKASGDWTLVPILLMGMFVIACACYSLPALRPYFFPLLAVEVLVVAVIALLFITQRQRKGKIVSNTSMDDIDRMSGTEFELFLKMYFEYAGYKATTFGGAGDGGADLILEKDNKRIVIQAKRYSGAIPYSAVQQVFTAKALYKCDEAWIVCNRYLTKQAYDASKELGVKVIGRKMLGNMLENVRNKNK